MYKGYKIIDADSHIMEPDDLWERYLEPEFQPYALKSTLWSGTGSNRVLAFRMPFLGKSGDPTDSEGRPLGARPYISNGEGGLLSYYEAYKEFIDLDFSPKAYGRYLDWRGLDYIILYPTVGLFMTVPPSLDPKVAAATVRAYNNWLYDFCAAGDGRLVPVGALDLRDVDLAIKEARRCVKELGFKSVYILPDPPHVAINSPYYDPLWAEVASLGVPLGTHECASAGMFYPHTPTRHFSNLKVYGNAAVPTFLFGEMLAAMMFTLGGICARHPDLKVVFTEASAGWAAPFMWFLDEKWERSTILGELWPPERPSIYFRRQCSIACEPEEPGIKYMIDFFGDDANLIYNTDFPHPSEAKVLNPTDEFLALPGVSDESKRRILWDNAATLYKLS